ncbi:MAG: OmpA family protein [Labilithrix sp.]
MFPKHSLVIASFIALSATSCGTNRPKPASVAEAPSTTLTAANIGGLRVSDEVARACALPSRPEEAPKFGFDDDTLSEGERELLAEVGRCVSSGPLRGRRISLVGHTDRRGSEQYNLALGARRANAVARHMAALGVDPGQLRETSRGELDATGTDEDTWRLDRRVDIQLAD